MLDTDDANLDPVVEMDDIQMNSPLNSSGERGCQGSSEIKKRILAQLEEENGPIEEENVRLFLVNPIPKLK